MKKLFSAILLLLLCGSLRAQTSTPAIRKILSAMPATDQQAFHREMDAVGALGAQGLETMASMLQPPGQGDNTALEYALNGFASYVTGAGKESWRAAAVQAYGHALAKLQDPMSRQLLIHQLQLVGRDDAVPYLQTCLNDKMLAAPAAQALATIASPAAEQALLGALQHGGAAQASLVQALGDLHSTAALRTITPLAESGDAALRKAALYALARIADPSSAPVLLKAAKKSGFAFGAENAASDCLLYAGSLLDRGQAPAARKVLKGLLKGARKHKLSALQDAARGLMDRGHAADSTAPNTLSAAEKKAGYQLLFNGQNLDHWVGNKDGYVVENGAIAVHPAGHSGGNLYTEGEYGNFVFRFEFQLTPGANNGIGIRAPLEGDAAYVGMEIQVLDNTAPVYADLQPYQYHGSVYGVIPAKRGYLKPVGEWNTEEIRAEGTHIRVTLNGHVIVDGDIAASRDHGTADHKSHPGLKNTRGHIGFLGHGSVVRFRNLRVLDLDQAGR